MYIQALLLLAIEIECIFSSVVLKPTGNQYVKSNLQLTCTDESVDYTQPEWISPSSNKIDTFQPSEEGANCDNAESCNAEFGRYCQNSFASCVNGFCACQQFGIDPCSCLASLNDCHMIRGNSENITTATLVGNDPLQYTSCESNIATDTEVHVIAMVYGIQSPVYTNVNVNILNRNMNTDKEVVLVLVSDRLVFWEVNIQNNETVDRLVQLSSYQDEDNLKVDHRQVNAIDKPKDAPYGIGDDAIHGGKTVDMMLYLEENYGHVSSFTATEAANSWNITIDLARNTMMQNINPPVVFTENLQPWQTKLTLAWLQNDEDYGTYTCRGKHSQNNLQILKREPIVVQAPHKQNITFYEGGVIRCDVTGLPKPKVSWLFDGQYDILEGGSLNISKVTIHEDGTFECRGDQVETGDTHAESIKVTIIHSVPEPPVIRIPEEDVGSYIAKIHINSTNAVEKFMGLHYIIYYNDQNLTTSSDNSVPELISLTPSTLYDVHAVAVSMGGTSQESNHIKFTTKVEITTMQPTPRDVATSDVTVMMLRDVATSDVTVMMLRDVSKTVNSQVTEKPRSSSKKGIIAACSIGAFIVFVLFIIFIIFIYQKLRSRQKPDSIGDKHQVNELAETEPLAQDKECNTKTDAV
ncbi:uncharacterized protein [Antedon mediterranea]|uniref:uncharacterized protein isoform X2 n=1 Tax=Antedon mediterranea TaxID=105859 RepID=UPI003AF74805